MTLASELEVLTFISDRNKRNMRCVNYRKKASATDLLTVFVFPSFPCSLILHIKHEYAKMIFPLFLIFFAEDCAGNQSNLVKRFPVV